MIVLSKKSIVKGTLILSIAGFLTKALGFYNRIFLTRAIGVLELGIYQMVFPLYLLMLSLCCQGISVALTKAVSFYFGKGAPCSAKKALKASIIYSLTLCLLTCFTVYCFSKQISLRFLKNSDCQELIKILLIAVPFVCVKACINSFFVGANRPGLHGISHLIEQIFRIGAGYILLYTVMRHRPSAALAIIALVTGEICATILALIFYRIYFKDKKSCTADSFSSSALIKDSVPLTLNNVMLTLFSSFEAMILPAMLFKYLGNQSLAIEQYGIITGIVLPFIMFPATLTGSLSTMLLPAVSYANAKNDRRSISGALRASILFCIVFGFFAWIFYQLGGEFLCELAFKNKEAGSLLRKMSYLCPLLYISGNLSSILNGVDKTFLNLMFYIIGISVRIFIIIFFVPKYGLTAYVGALTLSYVTQNLMMLLALSNYLPSKS